MFDYSFWLVFIGAAIALNLAPGPDVLYILTKTISGGKKIGIASSIGVCTGALFHVVIAAAGLSAILVTSAVAFTAVKYIGAAYLLYLAYHAFRSSGTSLEADGAIQGKESAWKAFKQGVLIDILNPKVAIFFMAFLPQFLREDHGSTAFQLMYLGMIVILVALFVEAIIVMLAAKIAGKFRDNKQYSIWLDRIVGTVFVALGLKLVTSSNP